MDTTNERPTLTPGARALLARVNAEAERIIATDPGVAEAIRRAAEAKQAAAKTEDRDAAA